MLISPARVPLAALCATTMVVSILGAAAPAAADTGGGTPDAAVGSEARPLGTLDRTTVRPIVAGDGERVGTLTAAPQMSLTVQQRDPGRRGGVGSVEAVLMRRADGGMALRGTRVELVSPSGTSISSAGGSGWRCGDGPAAGRRIVCRHVGPIPRGDTPAEIVAAIAVDRTAAAFGPEHPAEITARAWWAGDPSARPGARWVTSGSGSMEVRPPLSVGLTVQEGPTAHVVGSDPSDRQLTLLAAIGGHAGAHVAVHWSQLAGPPTTFLRDQHLEGADELVSQVVQLGDLPDRDVGYRFAVRVESNGDRVTRRVAVRVSNGDQLREVRPNTQSFDRLAGASLRPRVRRTHRSRDVDHLRIVGPARRVAPGSTHTLRVVTRKVRPTSYLWVLPRDEQDLTVSTGTTYRMVAPSLPGAADVVEVIVTTARGAVLRKAFTLSTRSRRAPTATVHGRGRVRAADDKDEASIAKVCETVGEVQKAGGPDQIQLALTEGTELRFARTDAAVIGPKAGPAPCSDGTTTLTIKNGTLTHASGQSFGAVSATYGPDGLVVQSLAWRIPTPMNPVSAPGADLTLTLKGTATATLATGEFSRLSGDLVVQPFQLPDATGPSFALSWLPLPGGWSFSSGSSVLHFVNESDATGADAAKDDTLRLSQAASGPSDATAHLAVDYHAGAFSLVRVSVANLSLGTTAQGDSVVASGEGQLDLTKAGDDNAVQLSVSCLHDGSAAECELFDGFLLKDFGIDWRRSGIWISANASVRHAGSQEYAFGVTGDYQSRTNWGLDVTSAGDWSIGSGMALTEVKGEIERRPVDPDKPDVSTLTVSVKGTLTGLTFSDSVSAGPVTGEITNRCPESQKDCDTEAVRVSLDAMITATLPGASSPTELRVSGEIDLGTRAFTFETGIPGVQFGPEALRLRSPRFTLTNDPSNACVPKGTDVSKTTGLIVGVQAETTVLGQEFTVNAQWVTGKGLCFWGNRGAFELKNGVNAVDSLVTYTTYAGGADLHVKGYPVKVLDTPAVLSLSGSVAVPQQIRDAFSIPAGNLAYAATLQTDLKAGSLDISYSPTAPVRLYQTASSSLTLTQIGFTISYKAEPPEFDMKATAKGALFIDGSGDTPASTTPLGVSVGIKASGTGFQLTLQAGVETAGGVVSNAFGQKDLTVRQLAVAATIGLPLTNSELSVNASVTLPPAWNSTIGLMNNPPVALAFKLSKADPCLLIKIGQEGGTQTVIDIGHKGFLTAKYLQLVIAPKGCTLPSGGSGEEKIAPGFAFAFDGEIAKAPITVILNVGLKDGLTIKGTVVLPKLDFYALKLSDYAGSGGPKVTFDIDTKASRYNVTIDGAVEVGAVSKGIGAAVRVTGQVNTADPDYTIVDLTGNGALALGPVSAQIQPLSVHVKMAKAGGDKSQNYAYGQATIRFSVLGINVSVAGNLDYRGGQLVSLGVALGARFWFLTWIDGAIGFHYCLGTISDVRADGSGNVCTPFAATELASRTPAMRVSAYGHYKILAWWKSFTWIVWQRGAGSRSRADNPLTDDLVLSGPEPSGPGLGLVSSEFLRRTGGDVTLAHQSGSVAYKTVSGAAIEGAPPCSGAVLGLGWDPSADDPNPEVVPADPLPQDADERCGLSVATASVSADRAGPVTVHAVLCTASGCTLDGARLSDGEQSTESVRARLILGLRVPAGTMPATGSLVRGADLLGPDGRTALTVRGRTLLLTRDGEPLWRFSHHGRSPREARFELRPDGTLAQRSLHRDANGVRRLVTDARIGIPLRHVSAKPTRQPVLVLAGDRLTVYRTPDISADNALWGIDLSGRRCFSGRYGEPGGTLRTCRSGFTP